MTHVPTAPVEGGVDRPMRRLGYQPALDGIRAIAVIAVIVHHAFNVLDWPRGGSFGMTTFFVASGFLITVLLLQERANRSRISLASFYRRRALRLMRHSWCSSLASSCIPSSTRSSRSRAIGRR